MVQPGESSGEPFGIELHVVDGRLIACRPGETPPLSVREHTKAFLEWLRNHEKTGVCPSCFDELTEQGGIRYSFEDTTAMSWSDVPAPKARPRRKR